MTDGDCLSTAKIVKEFRDNARALVAKKMKKRKRGKK